MQLQVNGAPTFDNLDSPEGGSHCFPAVHLFEMLFTFANLETTFLRSRSFNASSRLQKRNWLEVTTPLADNN